MEQAKCAGSLSNCQAVARCGKVIPLGVGSRAPVLLPGRLSPADQAGRQARARIGGPFSNADSRFHSRFYHEFTKPWGWGFQFYCLSGWRFVPRLVYVQCSDKLGFAQIIQWRSHVPHAALLTGRWLHDHLFFLEWQFWSVHAHTCVGGPDLIVHNPVIFFGCPKPKVSFPAGNPTDAGPSILVPQRVHSRRRLVTTRSRPVHCLFFLGG